MIARLVLVAVLTACNSAFADDTAAVGGDVAGPVRSIWDGVFSDAQARRGQAAYTGPCSRCHGSKLDGAQDEADMLPSPPVADAKFLRRWDGRSLAALFEYTHATMPANNPGFLTDQEVVDVIAYMLAVSGAPTGSAELPPDSQALARILIRADGGVL